MTFTRGLFIHPDATRGTTALEARQALAGLVTSAGVLDGLTVTGTAGWQYEIAAGHLVSTRGRDTDGMVAFGNDAPVLVDCTPAPGTGARIDIIYAKHNDATSPNADSDAEAFAGVAEGAASGSPVAPTIPEGAVELARATVTAGAVSTSDEGVTISHGDTPRAYLRGSQPVAGGRSGSADTSVPNNQVTVVNPGPNSDHYMGGVTGVPNGLRVPVAGWYQIDAGLRFDSNATGYRRILLQINGANHDMVQQPAAGQNTTQLSRSVYLEAGDEVRIAAWQNSGSSLSTSSGWGYPYLTLALIARP